MSIEDQEKKMQQEELKILKDRLRSISREYSENAVIEAA